MRDLKKAWTGRIESLLDNVRTMIDVSLTTINPTITKNIEDSFSRVDKDLRERLQDEEVVPVPPEIVKVAIKSLDECEQHLLRQVGSESVNWWPVTRKAFADKATRAFAARRLLEEYIGLPDTNSLMVPPPIANSEKAPPSKKSRRRD